MSHIKAEPYYLIKASSPEEASRLFSERFRRIRSASPVKRIGEIFYFDFDFIGYDEEPGDPVPELPGLWEDPGESGSGSVE